MKTTLLLLLIYLSAVYAQAPIFDYLRTLLLRQGIPFREESFLDNRPILPEYDFIVVGSGPAGSAVANRLSAMRNHTVLLLEKGEEGNVFNDIPFVNEFTVLGDSSTNYAVERDENVCLGLVGGHCHWPSGNGVGGASIINAMIFTRGFPRDFDEWALQGNPGWSYDDVLPTFLKLENMSIPELASAPHHSTTGPVHIQYPFLSKIGRRILQAGQQLGYNLIDYNDPNSLVGFARTQATMKGVKRHSSVSSYLLDAKSRSNLHVVKGGYVTKILINSETKRAYGVTFIKNNRNRTVRARKEIVISAGAFGSPHLLMLSGIGHADHLQEMRIPLVADLPVGDNLQEHLGTPVTFLINATESVTLPKLLISLPVDLIQWSLGQMGLLSSNIAETLGYIQTKHAQDERADIELLSISLTFAGDGGTLLRRSRNLSSELYQETYAPINFAEGFTILPIVMYPKSKGSVRLRSPDAKDPVMIFGGFYSDPQDVKVLIEGVREAIRVSQTRTFQEIGARLYTEPVLGCEDLEFNSDAYWDCQAKVLPIQFHHQCGTCRMGPDPSSSVVGPRLKVHGVNGLRVADASIMPSIPGIHTMAPSYMIGEKAAEFIKQDISNQ